MFIGKRTVIGLETHVNAETSKQKLGFLGNNIMHARIGLRTHEFSLHAQARSCVCRSLPKKPNLNKTRVEPNKN